LPAVPARRHTSRRGADPVKHALSVDVEDWFMVLNLKDQIDRSEWERIELRCGDSTRRLLELLARRDAKATFFFLGWVAERLPDLVKEVHDAGHEIGSHGYDHRCLHELSADSFRAELQRTSKALEAITGTAPSLFRACRMCCWTKASPWTARSTRSAIPTTALPARPTIPTA
jgi:hypothetical protein